MRVKINGCIVELEIADWESMIIERLFNIDSTNKRVRSSKLDIFWRER